MLVTTLDDLLIDTLRSAHDAEQHLVAKLPALIHAGSSPDLHEILDDLGQSCLDHANRIADIAAQFGAVDATETKHTPGAFFNDDNLLPETMADAILRDITTISFVQQTLRLQSARYTLARSVARELGSRDISNAIQGFIDNEERIDKSLSDIMMGGLLRPGLLQRAPRKQVTTL